MKINFEYTNVTEFEKLANGDTFIDPDIFGDAVLMRVYAGVDVVLDTEEDVREEFDGYAVNLLTGEICGYRNDEEIIPIKFEGKAYQPY